MKKIKLAGRRKEKCLTKKKKKERKRSKELDLLSPAKWRLIEDTIPIYKYTELGLLKLKGDLGIAGDGDELPALSQATNSKVFRCHRSEALKNWWEQYILTGLSWIQTLAILRDIFNEMAEAKGVGCGKMYQININQPKTIVDFRAMALLGLHRSRMQIPRVLL